MPRARKSADERLNDSINVPVNRRLKRRVVALAGRSPGTPSPTRLARMAIEEFVAARETAETAKA
jgi:hypothetical protein